MAKWCGVIGYAESKKTKPGVWTNEIVEHKHFGEVRKNTRKLESSGTLNDDINISNIISIIADPYARQNFHSMKYVEFMGTKWIITNVEVEFPRLILTIGGEYNG